MKRNDEENANEPTPMSSVLNNQYGSMFDTRNNAPLNTINSNHPPPQGNLHAQQIYEEDDSQEEYEEMEDEDEGDFEEESLLGSLDLGMARAEPRGGNGLGCWKRIRGFFSAIRETICIFLMLNEDNIWDNSPSIASGGAHQIVINTRHKLFVFFWFLVLALAYAVERSSFKVLVDRAGPFRLFYAEVITGTHALVLGTCMMVSSMSGPGQFSFKDFKLPLADVAVMAVLDTTSLLFSLISTSHVPPVLTIILIQFTIPLSVCFTQCYRQDQTGGLTMQQTHLWGAIIIFIAVALALCPSISQILNPDAFLAQGVTWESAWNTVLFAASCIPAAACMLYKEQTLLRLKQPVDPNMLDFIMSVFQFMFAGVVSPLLYSLQGLGAPGIPEPSDSWVHNYPPTQISANFADGAKCFTNFLHADVAETRYAEPARCDYSWGLVLAHVFAVILIGVSVNKLVNARATTLIYRGISAGVIVAVFCMYLYERAGVRTDYGPFVNSLYLTCTIMLIIGSEIFNREGLPDANFETVYAEVENMYED